MEAKREGEEETEEQQRLSGSCLKSSPVLSGGNAGISRSSSSTLDDTILGFFCVNVGVVGRVELAVRFGCGENEMSVDGLLCSPLNWAGEHVGSGSWHVLEIFEAHPANHTCEQ